MRSVGLYLLVLAGTGCGLWKSSQETEENQFPFAGTEVRLVLPAGHGLASPWTPGLEDWAARTKADYSVSEVDFSAEEDWLVALQSQSPTLVLLPTTLVNRLTAEGLAAPIPEAALTENVVSWSSILPSVRQALGMVADHPTVFPATCPPLVVYCRTDLLEAAGRKLPETWEEYDELVTTVSDWAPGLTAIEPRGQDSLAALFLARAAASAKLPTQYSFELDSATGDPLIASQAFVRSLERMSRLTPALSPDSPTASFDDCRVACYCGNAAIAIMTLSTDTAVTCEPPPALPPNSLGYPAVSLPLPGSRTVFDRESGAWKSLAAGQINRPALCGFGGWSACVLNSASETEQSAAWDLWGSLLAYQDDGIIPPLPGVPCRDSTLARDASQAAGSSGESTQMSFDRAMTSDNTPLTAELPCAGRERLLAALAESIRQALEQDMPAQEALDRASDEWTRIIEAIGRKQVLNSYRQRLGLTPLN